jgi:hypothetical protein
MDHLDALDQPGIAEPMLALQWLWRLCNEFGLFLSLSLVCTIAVAFSVFVEVLFLTHLPYVQLFPRLELFVSLLLEWLLRI